MPRPAPETLADYVVVGITPALIMLLVGSLVFFLIGVFYQGDFPYRLTWVMGLFVLATVCVARISMEEGAGYAALFGIPLGVVVGIAVVYFVEIRGPLAPFSALINWSLLGLIWWCAHQLTWDCTLLDDRRDTTGQGLLQSMGWEASPQAAEPADISDASRSAALDSPDRPPDTAMPEKRPWWERWFGHKEQPAAHGRWVVYFSVAALPLFGFGQYFIPGTDVAGRRFAFWMLVINVGGGLGLLLTTSFVGLRRYIRQRQLEMPVEMAAAWLSVGVMMILALLIAAAVLPRPAPEYSIVEAIEKRLGTFASPDRNPSRLGLGPEGAKAPPESEAASQAEGPAGSSKTVGSGQPSAEENQDSKAGASNSTSGATQAESADSKSNGSNESSSQTAGTKNGSPSGGSRGEGKSSSDQGNSSKQNGGDGEAPPKGADSTAKQTDSAQAKSAPQSPSEATAAKAPPSRTEVDANQSAEAKDAPATQNQGGSDATPSPPSPPVVGQLLGSVGHLLRLAFYAALAVLAAVLAWKYRYELLAAWRQFLKEISELWNRLFGQGQPTRASEDSAPARVAVVSFRDFPDPFASGLAQRQSLPQLVQYSFEALQAWGQDFASRREQGQTPHEFGEALASQQPTVGLPARQLAEIYSRMAYAGQAPPPQTVAVLQALWRAMAEVAQRPLTAGTVGTPVGSG